MAISLNTQSARATKMVPQTPALSRSKTRTGIEIFRNLSKPVKSGEVTFFASLLSLMLEIGTPLNMALKAICGEIQNPRFKEIITALSQDVEEGRQLSAAMERHPRIFDSTFISLVRAGETGGFLKKILDRVVEMQEKRQALMTQLKSALTYPAVLCIVGLLVVVFVLVGVLPKFTAFFEGKESILPWTTRFLMFGSASLRGYWWAYILTVFGLFVGLRILRKSEQGQALMARFFISGPLISSLTNKIYTCEMLRTLGHMLESQVPLLEALKVTRPTIRNQYYRRFIDQLAGNVDRGGSFSQPFADYPYIPQTVKQMVAIGEEAGRLPTVMLRLARYYDNEIDHQLKKFAAIIEPMALIVMGAVVALIVSSVILPMFKLAQAVS